MPEKLKNKRESDENSFIENETDSGYEEPIFYSEEEVEGGFDDADQDEHNFTSYDSIKNDLEVDRLKKEAESIAGELDNNEINDTKETDKDNAETYIKNLEKELDRNAQAIEKNNISQMISVANCTELLINIKSEIQNGGMSNSSDIRAKLKEASDLIGNVAEMKDLDEKMGSYSAQSLDSANDKLGSSGNKFINSGLDSVKRATGTVDSDRKYLHGLQLMFEDISLQLKPEHIAEDIAKIAGYVAEYGYKLNASSGANMANELRKVQDSLS